MARSRYSSLEVIDGNHYSTWVDPCAKFQLGTDILDGVDTVDHILNRGERLDHLAYRYYGDAEYWWVIALANRIQDPFKMAVGLRLRIPTDVKSILSKVQR